MNAINPSALVLIGEVSTALVREDVWIPNRLRHRIKICHTESKLLFLRFHFD